MQYKIGDQVELISGGPAMTVTRVTDNPLGADGPSVICCWFASGKREEGEFPAAALKPTIKTGPAS